MIQFFTDCVSLFNDVYYAADEIPIFSFLLGYVMIVALIALFMSLSRGTRKM